MDIEEKIGTPLIKSETFLGLIIDPEDKILWANRAFSKATELSTDELTGKDLKALLAPLESDYILQDLSKFRAGGTASLETWNLFSASALNLTIRVELQEMPLQGQICILVMGTLLSGANNFQLETQGMRTAVDAAEIGLWDLDLKKNQHKTNAHWWTMLGYPPLQQGNIRNFFAGILHPDDRQTIITELKRLKDTGSLDYDTIVRLKDADENYRFIKSRGRVLEFNENHQVSRIVGVHIDITEQIKTSQKLDHTRQLLELTEELSKKGSFEINLKTKEISWTPGLFKIMEQDPAQGVPDLQAQQVFFSEEDNEHIYAAFQRCSETGNEVSVTTTLNLPDGKSKYLQFAAVRSLYNHNIISGTVNDVTEQKLARRKILASEENYRLLTESMPHIVWRNNLDGSPSYMNPYGTGFFGIDEDVQSRWVLSDYLHPEENDSVHRLCAHSKANKKQLHHILRLRRYDGEYRWFQVIMSPHLNDEGEIKSWTGVASNIHNQVITSESLQLSNSRLRSLIDASPVAIYSINTAGVIQDFWNPAAERLLGWTRDEVIGKFLPHINDSLEDEFLEMIRFTKENGSLTRRIKRYHKEGHEKILEVTGGCIYDKDGNVTEILVTVMDMTEIEESREQINKSLKEKETLLQEIHHRVKNNLAIVVSLLQLQVFRSTNEEEKYRLTQAQNRVYSIAMVHELLYQTDEFSKVNLSAYYDKLITSVKSNMQLGDMKVNHELRIGKLSLNINQAIPLGLLINELVTNSFKYAFNENEEEGVISLSIDQKEDIITVIYSDSGPGFDQKSSQVESGLGMRIIESLIDQLDAQFCMETDGEFKLILMFKEKSQGSAARTNY